MHGPCASSPRTLLFLFAGKGAHCSLLDPTWLPLKGCRGRQTAGLGSGADTSGVGTWTEDVEKQRRQEMGVISTRPGTCEIWVGLFASAIEGSKRGRQTSAGYRSRRNWRWVRAETGSCLVSLVVNGGCRCLRQAAPFFSISTGFRGKSSRCNVVTQRRRRASVNHVSHSLADLVMSSDDNGLGCLVFSTLLLLVGKG